MLALCAAACGEAFQAAVAEPSSASGSGEASGAAGSTGATPEASSARGSGGSSGAAGTGGEGGAATLCEPGKTRACYSGPAGTEGVGICRAGKRRCSADGSSWGPCQDEIVPSSERCAEPDDEDCDGVANEPEAGCLCEPGEHVPCYSGSAATEAVGQCKAGVTTCNAQGTGYEGSCEGEVLPQKEICTNLDDEDCDGTPCAAPIWAKTFGDGAPQRATRLFIDSSGYIVVGGNFQAFLKMGGKTLVSEGDDDVFVAKLDPQGNPQWAIGFGGIAKDGIVDLAMDATNAIYVAARYKGTVTIGETELSAPGPLGALVAKLDQSGQVVWIADLGDAPISAVAVHPDGVVVVGTMWSSMQVPGFGAFSPLGQDGFAAAYSIASGKPLWLKHFAAPGNQTADDVARDAYGNILVVGSFEGTFDLGTKAPEGVLESAGGWDVYVAQLTSWGTPTHAVRLGDEADQKAGQVLVAASGVPVATGTFEGTIDLGTGPLGCKWSGCLFVASLAPVAPVLSSVSVLPRPWYRPAVAIDPDGNLLSAGGFQGQIDLGGGVIGPGQKADAFIAKFDPSGAHIWSTALGGLGAHLLDDVAVDPQSGDVVFGGQVSGTFNLGPVGGDGDKDVLVARVSP